MNSFLNITRHSKRCLAALLPLLAAACSMMHEDYADGTQPADDNAVQLTLSIYTNQPYTTTREATGDVFARADQAESTIYDIQVWAFTHDGGDAEMAISYAEAENISVQSLDVTMNIGREYIAQKKKLDFYILANPKSIGLTGASKLPASSTRATLKAASFGNDHFGTTTLTHSVPATGLPITQVYKGSDGNGVDLSQLLITPVPPDKRVKIPLRRAISKLRFIFARQTGVEGVQITKIELYDESKGLIPQSQLAFPNESNLSNHNLANLGTSPSYVTDRITYSPSGSAPLLATTDIGETDDPELLRSDCTSNGNATKTAQAYQDFIDEKISAKEATEYGLTYLHESDRKLKGKIYYKYSATGAEQSKEFFMDPDNAETNFVRNHTWTVYAYFLGGGLYVEPQVMPWQWGGELQFFSKTSVQLNINQTYTPGLRYLMYSIDSDFTSTWNDNYCAIAYGFQNGRPLYSPWLELQTTSMNILQLQTNNTHFGFVVYDPDEGTYSDIVDEITIPTGQYVKTNFYVVPKEAFDLSNPPNLYVNVTIVERMGGGDDITVSRLPWNHLLPGSETGETAQFRYVTGTEFQQNIDGTSSTLYKY